MTAIDTTDPELQTELAAVIAETLDVLDETMIGGAPIPPVALHDGVTVESVLRIAGDDRAAGLVLWLSADDAVALTAALLGDDPSEVSLEDAVGSVGEMSNVLAGAAKTLFAEETELRVPVARAVPDAELEDIEAVEVTHRLGRFRAHLGA